VTFTGNGYSSSQAVYNFAMKRAAQLALQNGYPYFTVLSSKNYDKSGEVVAGTIVEDVEYPISVVRVKFHKQKVANAYTAKKVDQGITKKG